MENFVITISRKFGSQGHEIAGRLGELLQIPVYDRSYVEAHIHFADREERAGENITLPQSEKLPAKTEEAEGGKGFMSRLFRREAKDTASDESQAVLEAQTRLIRELAFESSCIILGRCADRVLHDFDRSLNVFIFAPDRERIVNCMNMLHTDETSARALMVSEDRARMEYRRRFLTDYANEVSGRQLLIDSSVFGVEKSAGMIAEAARYLFYGQDC